MNVYTKRMEINFETKVLRNLEQAEIEYLIFDIYLFPSNQQRKKKTEKNINKFQGFDMIYHNFFAQYRFTCINFY